MTGPFPCVITYAGLFPVEARVSRNEPAPPSFQVPADLKGFWQWRSSHFPKPSSHLHRTVGLLLDSRPFTAAFAEFSLPVETVEFRVINGYGYMRVRPLGGNDSPPRLLRRLWRIHPRIRRRIYGCRETVRSGKHRRFLEEWDRSLRDRVMAELNGFLRADLAALDSESLVRYLEDLLAALRRHVAIHFALHCAISLPVARLAWACARLPGDSDLRMARLLAGLSPKSVEPTVELARLAREASRDPDLRATLTEGPAAEALAAVQERFPGLARSFEAYLDRYGHRVVDRYDIAERTLAEQPEQVLALLQEYVRTGYDPEAELARQAAGREAAESETLALLTDAAERDRFRRILAAARLAYPVRDDNVFYTISMPLAVARYACLHVGRRLAARGVIEDPEDVFLLTYQEAVAALRGHGLPMHAAVAQRRAELAAQARVTPPRSLGQPPPDPPLHVFPPEVQEATRAMVYYMERVFEPGPEAQTAGGTAIRGVPASSGTHRGTARVILHASQFGRLQPGEVLVCPTTTPAWSVLFSRAGALVTDAGGVLSHPAIIAREYGIPAVVATGVATATIPDGRTVVVDGTAGTVTLV